ncbi:MAG: glycine cleavage system protein GcvH [Thermodesulfobacteriota bacterium]
MKEPHELNLPEDVRYSEDHEWARRENGRIRVGIDDYAQDQLGEIVYVELPKPGDFFEKGTEFGTVESVKAVSELFMPVGGKVTAVNTALGDSPELVNTSPYGDGWMLEVEPAHPREWEELMDRAAYLNRLQTEE